MNINLKLKNPQFLENKQNNYINNQSKALLVLNTHDLQSFEFLRNDINKLKNILDKSFIIEILETNSVEELKKKIWEFDKENPFFFYYYVGHGGYDEKQGSYLPFQDGVLNRNDFLSLFKGPQKHSLIFSCCNSGFYGFKEGPFGKIPKNLNAFYATSDNETTFYNENGSNLGQTLINLLNNNINATFGDLKKEFKKGVTFSVFEKIIQK